MLETIYLSMDANFKLKQKERGFTDPPLANGLAYMVSNKKLLKHLAECKDKLLKDEVGSHLIAWFVILTLSVRPSRVAQNSMPSMMRIPSTQPGMLSQVLEV